MEKYVIAGFAHHGTSSLEYFLKKLGIDVIRRESEGMPPYPNRKAIFIYNRNKECNLSRIDDYVDPIMLDLDEMKKIPGFPHLNKGSTMTRKEVDKLCLSLKN